MQPSHAPPAAVAAAVAAAGASAAQAVHQPRMAGAAQASPKQQWAQVQVLLAEGKGAQELPSWGLQACAWEQSLNPAPGAAGLVESQHDELDVILQQTPRLWVRAVAWGQPGLLGR